MMTTNDSLRALMTSSFILGGSPCSGKSTLAERLSAEYQFPYYKVDDHLWRHLEQADPRLQPTMAAYGKMSWDQIWSQPVVRHVRDVFAYYTEQFPMVLDDLMQYKDQAPIIMEGAAFLPTMVHECGVPADKALFLVPSKSFQIEHYSQRPWVKPILESCADPEQAFANWMERDHRFGLEIIQQAEMLGYCSIVVDGQRDIERVYQHVKENFRILPSSKLDL